MKILQFEVEGSDGGSRCVDVPYHEGERVEDAVARLERESAHEYGALLDAGAAAIGVPQNASLGSVQWPGHSIRLRVVCVAVRFEGETKESLFPANARWARVHRWACNAFGVAADACGHLELHDGDPKGPVLNESHQIGRHDGCRTVCLVKPGPEPNG